MNPITFNAEIIKIQTTKDRAYRLTLDIPEIHANSVQQLIEVYQSGAILELAALAIIRDDVWDAPQN